MNKKFNEIKNNEEQLTEKMRFKFNDILQEDGYVAYCTNSEQTKYKECPYCGANMKFSVYNGIGKQIGRCFKTTCIANNHVDVFDYIKDTKGLGFKDAKEYLKKYMNSSEMNIYESNKRKINDCIPETSKDLKKRTPTIDEIKSEVLSYQKNLNVTEYGKKVRKYLNDRGIDDALIKRYKLGAYYKYGNEYVVLPLNMNNTFYELTFRDINYNENSKYGKYMNFSKYKVSKNITILDEYLDHNNSKDVYVTEGFFDAIMLRKYNEKANIISINSASNYTNLIQFIVDFKKIILGYELEFKLLLDNDSSGNEANNRIKDFCVENGIKCDILTNEKISVYNVKDISDLNEMQIKNIYL